MLAKLETDDLYMEYAFETEMEVRDYECDIQGIVNNANYLHYIEHTRHLYLTQLGVSFAKLHEQGIEEGLRYVFYQDIFRKDDGRLSFRSTVELVCLINGRLGNSDDYDRAFGF